MKLDPTRRVASLLPWVALLGLAPATARSQAPEVPGGRSPAVAAGEQGAEAREASSDARELRRVLSLAGGGFVRAKSRLEGDAWAYRDGSEWKTLPAERVVKVAVERELLAESRRLAAELEGTRSDVQGGQGGSDTQGARRAAYADWLCGSGLLAEGVRELDRVLADDPDCALALGTCAKLADFVRAADGDASSEAGLAAWLRAGAGHGAAMREVALHQLRERVGADALVERLGRELGASSPRARAFAALGLRRLRPGAELVPLISRAVLDGSESVRREAALALAAAAEPAVVVPVVRALGSQHAAVRANAVDTLATMGYPSAVEPLIGYLAALSAPPQGGGFKPAASSIFVGRQVAYVQDYDVEVAQFAAVADPQVNVLTEGSVLDVRVISAYTITAPAAARGVNAALRKLTQANPGASAVAWQAWWEANRGRLDAAAPRTGLGS